MADRKQRYHAYLLRMWQEQRAGKLVWRASLEEPHTGVRRGFANLTQLFAFLKAKIEEERGQARRPPD